MCSGIAILLFMIAVLATPNLLAAKHSILEREPRAKDLPNGLADNAAEQDSMDVLVKNLIDNLLFSAPQPDQRELENSTLGRLGRTFISNMVARPRFVPQAQPPSSRTNAAWHQPQYAKLKTIDPEWLEPDVRSRTSSIAKRDAASANRLSPAPGTPGASPGQTVRALYDAFNSRNVEKSGSLLAEDCIYEDLLLGPATVCRGRKAFESALRWHPAFLADTLARALPRSWSQRLPKLILVIDSVAEDPLRGSVGVEWHVETERYEMDDSTLVRITSEPFPLGRGLSHAKVNPKTGKIERVVDIAEAPWRVVGLVFSFLLSLDRTSRESVNSTVPGTILWGP